MYQFILFIHVFACAFLVLLVLVQQGKGATVGASFGSGASQTVFGSRGSGSFLLRVTTFFVVLFFATSLGLNYIASKAMHSERQIILPEAPSNKIPAPGAAVGITAPATPNATPSGTTTQQK